MNEKIIQFSKGDFEASQTGLILSDTSLIFQVEEGRTVNGSFYIGNNRGAVMHGILYSECPYITLARNNFNGRELSIEYTFSAKELSAGETINTTIHVITNCGETDIPVAVTIDIPSVDYESGRVKDLTGFAGLVKEDAAKALQIFRSPDFENIFLYRDIENQILYRTLIKSSQPMHAMEEFLVATRKKNRVAISVDKNNLTYDNCIGVFDDRIRISRSTWGCVEIIIRSDARFINPSHKRLWTDQFDDDYIYLDFTIDSGCMNPGVNEGKIYIETTQQVIEIGISCTPADAVVNERYARKRYALVIMQSFVNLRSGKITAYDFKKIIDELSVKYRGIYGVDGLNELCVAFAAVVSHSDNINECVEAIMPRTAPGIQADDEAIIDYALYLYVLAMSYSVMGDTDKAQQNISELYDMYEEGYDHWLIFCLINNLDSSSTHNHKTYMTLARYIREGCTSPVVYAQFCDVLAKDSSLIHDWNESMVRPLVWGAKRGVISYEVALRYAYHVSRFKNYNNMVFHSLERLYDKYDSDEILTVICGMLIKGGIANDNAHKWYRKGVDRNLRITQLYEYYIISLKEDNDEIIPHNVLMYFAYDNRLPDAEKAKLFASIIRGKKMDEVAYKAYTIMMSNYARRQLECGNITGNLAVIYEDCIKLDAIDESIALALPKVMFRKEVICINPVITHVCVVHNETCDEQIVPFTNGKAYVDIYSDDVYIFMVDSRGNRYYHTEDYTLRKLLHLDAYAEKCFEYSVEDTGLLTHMFAKCRKDYRTGEELIKVRRLAHKRLNLREHYARNNLSALIYYYYEHADGERLDDMLDNVILSEVERNIRSKWIELYIVRGMYLKALYAIRCYGYEGIDCARLGKLCEELVPRSDEELIWEGKELSETLIETAYEVYSEGGYTKSIIEYLVNRYNGATSNMISIWNAASGLGIDTVSYEERILERILMIEDNILEGIPVLNAYMQHSSKDVKTDDTCQKAYITYICYIYITGEDITGGLICNEIWEYIESTLMVEYNKICLLAVLKKYSEYDNLDEEHKIFCEVKLAELLKSGIVMSYFKRFEDKISTFSGTADREILQCVARPGIPMKLRCTIADGSTEIIKVPEVLDGIYVVELVVFAGETIDYEFYEETGNSKSVYDKGTVSYKRSSGDSRGRLRMINDMIELYGNEDYKQLYDKMERYVELDQTSKDLMVIL